MRIDWDQEAAGLNLVQIRDILRFTCRQGMHFGVVSVAHRIDVLGGKRDLPHDEYEIEHDKSLKRAKTLLDVLVTSGVVGEPDEETLGHARAGRHPGYDLTQSGFGLLRATKTKRITRKAADAAVALLRKAITEINSDPTLMHDVERVAIYGSYLTDAADLGDVDVAYALRRRWTDKDDYRRRKAAFEAVHYPPENQIGVYDYQYRWNEKIVARMLRTKACIQLTAMHHVEDLGCARLEIHPVEELVPAREDHVLERVEIRLVDDGGEARRLLDERLMAAAGQKKA